MQCDFLDPIHNKQDFNKTDRYKLVVFHCVIYIFMLLNYILENTFTKGDIYQKSDNLQCLLDRNVLVMADIFMCMVAFHVFLLTLIIADFRCL